MQAAYVVNIAWLTFYLKWGHVIEVRSLIQSEFGPQKAQKMTDPADVAPRAPKVPLTVHAPFDVLPLFAAIPSGAYNGTWITAHQAGDPWVGIAVATVEAAGMPEDLGAREIDLLRRILMDTEKCRTHFLVFSGFRGARGARVVVPWCHFPTISMDLTWEGSPFSPRMRFA